MNRKEIIKHLIFAVIVALIFILLIYVKTLLYPPPEWKNPGW